MARRAAQQLPDMSKFGMLAEYNRKRHFGVTPEPPGRPGQRSKPGRPLSFVVQKHRASRLHYDFRLEHDGVMLSWAIPKGPSLDPSVKRLAMQTEPHPIEYNQFEGVIPEGEYGGGTVMIWDLGTWEPEDVKRNEIKFRLRGEKLAGSWVLVHTDDRRWLLIKHRDESASDVDLTSERPLSVVSGRSMAEIARAAGATVTQLAQAAKTDPAPLAAGPPPPPAAPPPPGGPPPPGRLRRPRARIQPRRRLLARPPGRFATGSRSASPPCWRRSSPSRSTFPGGSTRRSTTAFACSRTRKAVA
jgi:DNA ligase D-like protein (predicted 3'-phosphoesterase)